MNLEGVLNKLSKERPAVENNEVSKYQAMKNPTKEMGHKVDVYGP